MQQQTTTSEQRLEKAKERLRIALLSLDSLIKQQNERLDEERQIRTKVIEDLDKHIDNLETILESNG